jgi:hypothetical protein
VRRMKASRTAEPGLHDQLADRLPGTHPFGPLRIRVNRDHLQRRVLRSDEPPLIVRSHWRGSSTYASNCHFDLEVFT